MNAKVTNALRKNIFIGSRHYKNVLLWFNHELVIVNTLPKIKKKKNAEFRRRRAPPSPVWVSKLAVQGREQDV